MSGRIELDFMVNPDDLKRWAFVPWVVKIRITDFDDPLITDRLGESGLKMAKDGWEFWFTEKIANELIEKKLAIKTDIKRNKYDWKTVELGSLWRSSGGNYYRPVCFTNYEIMTTDKADRWPLTIVYKIDSTSDRYKDLMFSRPFSEWHYRMRLVPGGERGTGWTD